MAKNYRYYDSSDSDSDSEYEDEEIKVSSLTALLGRNLTIPKNRIQQSPVVVPKQQSTRPTRPIYRNKDLGIYVLRYVEELHTKKKTLKCIRTKYALTKQLIHNSRKLPRINYYYLQIRKKSKNSADKSSTTSSGSDTDKSYSSISSGSDTYVMEERGEAVNDMVSTLYSYQLSLEKELVAGQKNKKKSAANEKKKQTQDIKTIQRKKKKENYLKLLGQKNK